MSEASTLRSLANAAAQAETTLLQDELEAHLALSLGDRFLRTVQLSAAHMAACPPDPEAPDDEAETWRSARAHLRAHPQ